MEYLSEKQKLVKLDVSNPIWDRFFTIAPLVVIGTKESRQINLAPKHMATPLGLDNYFGFVCTPRHSTYHNVKFEKAFTVSFPKPDQVILASIAALPRCEADNWDKKIMEDIPTFPAKEINAPFLQNAYLYLECSLHKIVDGFGDNSLITGKIIAAYVDENYLRSSEIDEQQMVYNAPLLAYLSRGRFAEIKHSNKFPFTKNFKL